MQARHDVGHLEAGIKDLRTSLQQLAESSDLEELIRHIHQPGWTTPAEFLLVAGMIESLNAQATAVAGLTRALVRGAAEVSGK